MPEGIRTPDPRLRRPLLYPAELQTQKAGDGNRTHVSSLEGWCSTIELHPHKVGVTGFEPATPWSQTRYSSQTEPHPETIQLRLASSVTQVLLYYRRTQLSTLFYFLFCNFSKSAFILRITIHSRYGFTTGKEAYLSWPAKPYLYG